MKTIAVQLSQNELIAAMSYHSGAIYVSNSSAAISEAMERLKYLNKRLNDMNAASEEQPSQEAPANQGAPKQW